MAKKIEYTCDLPKGRHMIFGTIYTVPGITQEEMAELAAKGFEGVAEVKEVVAKEK